MKLFIILLFLSLNTIAAETKIEPVYGFERTFHPEPKPSRYRTETVLGLRATYGTKHFALEAEVNQSTSNESNDVTDVDYKTESVLLGARLIPINSESYNLFFRGGMRAKRTHTEVESGGETTLKTTAVQYDPYAGAGIGIDIAGVFTLNTGATLIYNRNAEESEKYDTRYTVSGGIKFGNK